jgi:TRAP-type C4-dicarboxylate transport system substrate-binding protein
MDFTEVFTALETGIIDGADASSLANNKAMGLYDIAGHANYPGFHSMPSDHLACNKAVWEGMPEHHRAILSTGMESLALRTALQTEKANAEALAALTEQGVTIHTWSDEELRKFRNTAQEAWDEFATTPEAVALVQSHRGYLQQLGLID